MKYVYALICFFIIIRNFKRFFYNSIKYTGNYCLLIAHPDDESMFFAPTLLNLEGTIKIICLSKGNTRFNFRSERDVEMTNLCSKYKWNLVMYNMFDGEDWNINEISSILMYNYLINPFTTLITFDNIGISGHKNHISCYKSAIDFQSKIKVKTMFLKSVKLFQKYIFDCSTYQNEYVLKFKDYYTPNKMMAFHKSQMIWFRHLYLLFSRYVIFNSY